MIVKTGWFLLTLTLVLTFVFVLRVAIAPPAEMRKVVPPRVRRNFHSLKRGINKVLN